MGRLSIARRNSRSHEKLTRCIIEPLEARRLLTSAAGIIQGTVFDDSNGDGTRQQNEPPLSGWSVSLKPFAGTADPHLSVQSDAFGAYSFNQVPPGQYSIILTEPAGWKRSAPLNPAYADIAAGQTINQDLGAAMSPAAYALDSTFGSGGKAVIAGGYGAIGAFAEPDGKYLIVNYDTSLIRLNSDGSVDTTFGNGGRITEGLPISGYAFQQRDGKIVIAGLAWLGTRYDLQVARLNLNGMLDQTFGGTGIVSAGFSQYADYNAATLADNQDIIVSASLGTDRSQLGVARILPNGALDNSFGSGGHVLLPLSFNQTINAIATDSGGGVLLAGRLENSVGRDQGFLERLTVAGTVDGTFGNAGSVLVKPSYIDWTWNAILVQPDGQIVVGGLGDPTQFGLARYSSSGVLDPFFGQNGIETTSFSLAGNTTFSEINALALAPDGSIAAFGYSATTSHATADFAVVKYTASGIPDTYFGNSGKSTVALGSDRDILRTGFFLPDGRILAVGDASSGAMGPGGAGLVQFTSDSQTGSLSGTVFNDLDGNGQRDSGEPGVPGVTIYADLNNNAQVDIGEPLVTTDGSGFYKFGQLVAAPYIFREIPPSGATMTLPLSGTYPITLFAGVTGTANFGLKLPLLAASAGGPYSVSEGGQNTLDASASIGTITSYQWDLNYDGKTFTAEATGKQVTFSAAGLDGPSARTVAVRVTASGGATKIATAVVSIKNVAPTAQFHGTTIALGSAATVNFTNQSDPSPADMSAGFHYSFDLGNNGSFEISNSTQPVGVFPAADFTAAGTYSVRGRITDKDGGSHDYLASIVVSASTFGALAGEVYHDLDSNGKLGTGEAGVASVEVFLDSNNNGILDTGETFEFTDELGNFTFNSLKPGTYHIRQVPPAHWHQSAPVTNAAITATVTAGKATTGLLFGDSSALPVANPGGPYTVPEGGTITMSAAKSYEPGGTIVKYEWSGDYQGGNFIPDFTGVKFTESIGSWDGPSQHTGALRVTDSVGNVAFTTFTYTVANAPPTGQFYAGPLFDGSGFVVDFTSPDDPSPADRLAGYHYSFDYNNDGIFEVTNTDSTRENIPSKYLSPGFHSARGRIIDKDGGYTDYVQQFYVNPPNTGNIWGSTINDVNANGIFDINDVPLANRRVYLDLNKNGVLDAGEPTMLTDAGSGFVMRAVPLGTYQVREVRPAGWRPVSPASGYFTVKVANGITTSIQPFYDTQTALISGVIFHDTNGNGKQDAGEAALSGWTIYLDANNNGKLDPGELTFTTKFDGKFTLVVAAGTYHLREVVKSGYKIAAPTGGAYTITLGTGATATGKNFGDK